MIDLRERRLDLEDLSNRLDRIEERLPPVGAAVLRAQRASTRLAFSTVGGAGQAVADTVHGIGGAVGTGFRTITGTVTATGRRTVDAVEDELVDLADQAGAAAERARHAQPDDTWTRAELYDLAQEIELEGRSAMSKAELLAAVRTEDPR